MTAPATSVIGLRCEHCQALFNFQGVHGSGPLDAKVMFIGIDL